MKSIFKDKHNILLSIVLLLSILVRFVGLGYSHFYGDETKTFYLDKTIPATEFFMNQRKGPVQFAIVWVMEKVLGGYDEFWTRIPFALDNLGAVIIFYLIVRKLFDKDIALISTILFSFSGFNIAFARTIQYQSTLIFFGLLSIYLYQLKKPTLSALSLGLAFLAHYDAIFFTVPLLYLGINDLLNKRIKVKEVLIGFLLPLVITISIFYVPYIINGYFKEHTFNYIIRRTGGDETLQANYSLFTVWFYNPCGLTFLFLIFPIFLFFKDHKKDLFNIDLTLLWLVVPFVVFQFVITNPGTHIHNYLIPLYILSGYTLVEIYRSFKSKKLKEIYQTLFTVLFILSILRISAIYIPQLNTGYPWNEPKYQNIHNKYQLFVYGFPYDRNWDEIQEYFNTTTGRIEGVYTNDNDTIAQYYLRGLPYTKPGTNFIPQYYIDINDNQEFIDYTVFNDLSKEQFISNYEIVKTFGNEQLGATAVIYKRKTP